MMGGGARVALVECRCQVECVLCSPVILSFCHPERQRRISPAQLECFVSLSTTTIN
jgi:hypothetical protein